MARYNPRSPSQNLLDTAFKYGFAETISRPTHVTDRLYTLIDHISRYNMLVMVQGRRH